MAVNIIPTLGHSPLTHQVIYEGERYKVDSGPPIIALLSRQSSPVTIESVVVKPYSSRDKHEYVLMRINKKSFETFEVKDDKANFLDLFYVDKNIIDVMCEYLKFVKLNSFSESIDDAYYGTRIIQNKDLSSIADLC